MQNSNHLDNFENNGGIVLLDTKQLKAFLHIKGDATLWRYLKEGKIPQPKYAISRTKRIWDRDEVLNHLNKFSGGDK
ncbi:helix-turn-helix transcriptional regulator [Campylobacter devanensis]|uniref:helix-turn-helix transcriptional regulator n=1 Tax=Campylobacter devanensis TaxID=3161138 RepID=UPI000A33F4E2|nr:hypothetical protein [Campylobacter sp. P159]